MSFNPVGSEMKSTLFLLAFCLIISACDTPYTGPMLTVNDVDRYLDATGEDTVCLQDGFDSVCIKVIEGPQGERGPRGIQGEPGPPGKDGHTFIVIHEVPIEILVGIVVEKVVEVETIVEVQTIVETITTEYVRDPINVDEFVGSVIAALPAGTTRENYDHKEVVSAVEETLVTYTPGFPTQTTQITTVRNPTDDSVTDPVSPDVPNLPANDPIVVDENRRTIEVEGGSSDILGGADNLISLTIRTGTHDPFQCEGEHLDVTAYQNGGIRGHQHWGACRVGDDIVIFLKDHPALTCDVGPNTHELEIEGLAERVIVEEDCH